MNMIKTAVAATVLAFALATSAMAADSTSTTTPPAKTAKVKAPAKPRSEASIACSKDADAKGLHGAARKTFRKTCMGGKH